MNIVFLDFDGVLNNRTLFHFDKNLISRDCLRYFLEAIEYISKFINIKIVISSSWRDTRGIEYFLEYSLSVCNKELHKDIKKLFSYFHEDYCTKWLHKKRGYEIKEWLSRHPEVEKYICVDDDSDFLKDQPLLKTNISYGFLLNEFNILIAYFVQNEDTKEKLKFTSMEFKSIKRTFKSQENLIRKINFE